MAEPFISRGFVGKRRQAVLRIVKSGDSILLDARGAVYLRITNPKPLQEGIPGENHSLGG